MTDTLDRLLDCGVVAVLRGIEREAMIDTVEALHAGGVTGIEITADATDASRAIADVAAAFDDEILLGAGTVMDTAAASRVIEAGAEFVVSPHFDAEIVATTNRRGVVSGPGVMTPTEAADALAAGADLLKVFPASTVGPDHLGAMARPSSVPGVRSSTTTPSLLATTRRSRRVPGSSSRPSNRPGRDGPRSSTSSVVLPVVVLLVAPSLQGSTHLSV